ASILILCPPQIQVVTAAAPWQSNRRPTVDSIASGSHGVYEQPAHSDRNARPVTPSNCVPTSHGCFSTSNMAVTKNPASI
ncbi:hypothetical protein ACLOJK_034469, partial [Asimina triloba]